MFDSINMSDLFRSGGAPAFRFDNVGDTVTGTIISAEAQQQKDYATGDLKFWDDGKPMIEIVLTLSTALRDPAIEDDDGDRRVFVRGQMLTALKTAIRKSSDSQPKPGARITVAYSGDGEAKKRGYNAPKLYTVEYTAAAQAAVEAEFDATTASAEELEMALAKSVK